MTTQVPPEGEEPDLRALPLHPILGEGLRETLENPIRFNYRYLNSENDWGGLQRHNFMAEPVGAPATHHFTGEWGKSKTYGYDPELVDLTDDRFGANFTWKGHPEWQRDAYREPEAEGWGLRKPFEEQVPADPALLYRGLSHEEWEQARQRGYFQTNGSYNIGGEEGTMFSTEPGQAQSYAAGFAPWHRKPTFNAPSYVVAVPRPPDAYAHPNMYGDTPEIVVPGQIPYDQVHAAWQFRPYAMRHGDMLVRSEDYGKTWFGHPNSDGYYAWRPVPVHRVAAAPRKCLHCQGTGWINKPPGLMNIPSLDLNTGRESPFSWEPSGAREACPQCYGTGVVGLGRDQPDPMMPSDEHMNEWGAISQDYNIDPTKLPSLGTPRQGRATPAHTPLYMRWAFSPSTARVELSHNGEGHPLDVRYHSDLARKLNEPDLKHGYAYRIGGGWRLTDWEHKPVEDKFIVAQVMRALLGKTSKPHTATWTPETDPDWSRTHHGIPS